MADTNQVGTLPSHLNELGVGKGAWVSQWIKQQSLDFISGHQGGEMEPCVLCCMAPGSVGSWPEIFLSPLPSAPSSPALHTTLLYALPLSFSQINIFKNIILMGMWNMD